MPLTYNNGKITGMHTVREAHDRLEAFLKALTDVFAFPFATGINRSYWPSLKTPTSMSL